MILSFGCKETEKISNGFVSRKFPPDIQRVARRKLRILEAAGHFEDLMVPPGNRLEALQGTLRGYHSIRINRQWRIIFVWRMGNADNVKIVDYH